MLDAMTVTQMANIHRAVARKLRLDRMCMFRCEFRVQCQQVNVGAPGSL